MCRFFHAFKTNPHLFPGVGWVEVYFDWCISFPDIHSNRSWEYCASVYGSMKRKSWSILLGIERQVVQVRNEGLCYSDRVHSDGAW